MANSLLQTSPYLSFVRPNETTGIVYVTDTRGPSFPETSAESRAIFGIVDLRRKTTWEFNENGATLLQEASPAPISVDQLVSKYGVELIDIYRNRGWLQNPDEICRDYYLRTAQIEITTHCNWKCQFCPVATDPKPVGVMEMALFEKIIEQVQAIKTIEFVTFHFFNEPTLDPYFKERIDILKKYNVKLSLSTNISGLTAEKSDHIISSGVLHHLLVNLPSIEEDIFVEKTGSKTYAVVKKNLEYLVSKNVPVSVVVNGTKDEQERSSARIREAFAGDVIEIIIPVTCDRAGEVKSKYHQDVHVPDRLVGCSWPVNHAHFSVTGEMFLCCNDYHQSVAFGNINQLTIHEILASDAAITSRRKIFGVQESDDSYICRRCHDQTPEFPHRQFRPIASYPLIG